MKTIKDPKGLHNGGYGGPIIRYGTKDERREGRKLMKSIRHKLRMKIPLTEVEQEIVTKYNVTENYQLATNSDAIIYSIYNSKLQ